jgi:ferredoxin-NADP reductase
VGVRRLPVEILRVTDQVVIVALPGRRSRGEFVRVSREGREWHAFAVATTGAEGDGRYCLVIRCAGDWTERLARDAAGGRAPERLLVRRIRGYRFMFHAQAFRRVLVVATGAGIGPVLPYLLEPSAVDVRCVWIGRDHRAAVGDDLVGRPDVGAEVARLALGFETVFVVANAHVRDAVARVCEARGVPWYGPTFDS